MVYFGQYVKNYWRKNGWESLPLTKLQYHLKHISNLSQYAGNSGWKTPHPNKNQFLLTLSAMLALTYMFAHVHSHFSYVQIESVGFARFSSRRFDRPVTESNTRFYPILHCRLLVNWPHKTAVWNQYYTGQLKNFRTIKHFFEFKIDDNGQQSIGAITFKEAL